MRKKRLAQALSVLLCVCMMFAALPLEVLATAGDIFLPEAEQIAKTEQITLADGSLALQNEYIQIALYDGGYTSYVSTIPTALLKESGSSSLAAFQQPACEFITWTRGKKNSMYVPVKLKKATFVDKTPNGQNRAIKAEYELSVWIGACADPVREDYLTASATVYYELVRLTDDPGEKASSWGVLVTVGDIVLGEDSFPDYFNFDFSFIWGYTLLNFTGMGHVDRSSKSGGPAIKMIRTTVTEDGEVSEESSVVTNRINDLGTKHVPKGYSAWGDVDGIYITELRTDAYPWANPFVAYSDYYEKEISVYTGEDQPIRVALPQTVSAVPNDTPVSTYVICYSYSGFDFGGEYASDSSSHYLWGFHDLVKFEEELPSKPDEVTSSFSAKRLAVFKSGSGVTLEYVADDAALESLKKSYNASPIAVISGDCESTNGSSYTFTGGSALLSPTVTATWQKGTGKLVIHKDGTVEQSGVNLNAPSFKFYSPKAGAEDSLTIRFDGNGFVFDIEPDKNDAIIYVDIPYTTVKLEQALADVSGNLIFNGEIGFKTIFDGAEFSLEKLGYGLKEKEKDGKKIKEFKVNGVKASGSFDTAALFTLDLAKVAGEVNTFKGEERYAFELELNVFELFETEAKLALERTDKGTLIPDELWFYVKADPGIILVPPVPIGRLNGGGAGFADLAATVNGDYFAIPPIKLNGALTGTYLHLIEGTGKITIGPSEISLKATDVNLVGAGAATRIIDSFGYTLKLNGQERDYKGQTYKGLYFAGSKELAMKLPSASFNIIEVDTSIEVGAFGGLNSAKNHLYLGIGANATANGVLKIPDSWPLWGGAVLRNAKINLIVGGQTAFPIRGVSVSEGMKSAFSNIDMYLGVMGETHGKIFDARAWVLIPRIVQTKFKRGGGWDLEVKLHNRLSNWNWGSKGVTPVAQSTENAESAVLLGGVSAANFDMTSLSADQTPYILLAFDKNVTEEQVKAALKAENKTIYWSPDGSMDDSFNIQAVTDLMENENGETYRVVVLRVKAGETYSIDAGELTFESEEASVTPFEKLDLTLSGETVTGEVTYAEPDTTYVLRTYLAGTEGEADYLISEQILEDPANISVTLPTSGTLAPTGKYYVSSFLMLEKQVDLNEDGELEDALVAIDSRFFDRQISYTNTNEPESPENVRLAAVGNEVMHASWDAVADADGYSVHIYEEKDGVWTDTGFGYDLDKDTLEIDMALTVGGSGVEVSENGSTATPVAAETLKPNKDYKIGVRAYKTEEDGKYYSAETVSAAEYLPEYVPVDMTFTLNEEPCTPDEDGGVYQAYIGRLGGILEISSTNENARFVLTRMDTETVVAPDNAELAVYVLPEFEGSVMFRIDGIVGNDVTSEFLLVNKSSELPLITLSAEMFYTDEDGNYRVTGTTSAGGMVVYDDSELIAENDGSFAITGTLDERDDGESFILFAKDVAGNLSKPVLALITRPATTYAVTVSGSYAETSGAGDYAEGETVNLDAGTREGYTFAGWTSDSNITFADSKAAKTSFTMIGEAVTVTANWTAVIVTNAVTVSGSYAETSGAGDYAEGETVNLDAGTREGYTFAGWTSESNITFADSKAAKTSFTMIGEAVTVTANWTAVIATNAVTVSGSYAETSGAGDYAEGETVNLDAGTREGYTFSGWTSESNITFADAKAAKTSFTMIGEVVTVTANWTKNSDENRGGSVNAITYYAVSFETNGGTSVKSQSVVRGYTVSRPDAPTKDKFEFTGWYTDRACETLYDFSTKVTGSFTLYAGWKAEGEDEPSKPDEPVKPDEPTKPDEPEDPTKDEWKNPFTDVNKDDWFYSSVEYACRNGLMKGTSDTKFEPESAVTRGMFVTVLYRLENEPAAKKAAFTDIERGSYYENAVAWASENALVNGISENEFAPEEAITREQMAAILYRYAKFKGMDMTVQSQKNRYTDSGEIEAYAAEAVLWASEYGILTGHADGRFAPKDNAERAQMAAVFMRFIENLK